MNEWLKESMNEWINQLHEGHETEGDDMNESLMELMYGWMMWIEWLNEWMNLRYHCFRRGDMTWMNQSIDDIMHAWMNEYLNERMD